LVRFDGNDYSVPTQSAHQKVNAMGGLEEVRLAVNDRLVVQHRRDWLKEQVHSRPGWVQERRRRTDPALCAR
jgi:hypothetical protein